MEANADLLGGFESQRTYVDVFPVAVPAQQLNYGIEHLLVSEAKVDLEDLGGVAKALEMRLDQEREELFLVGVPVRPDALETAGTVVQGVRHQADMHVLVPPVLAVVEDPGLSLFRRSVALRVGLSLDRHRPSLRDFSEAATGMRRIGKNDLSSILRAYSGPEFRI